MVVAARIAALIFLTMWLSACNSEPPEDLSKADVQKYQDAVYHGDCETLDRGWYVYAVAHDKAATDWFEGLMDDAECDEYAVE